MRPELILVAAGFDLHREDVFSRAHVTEAAFGDLTRLILSLRNEIDNPPVLLALEGGYRIPALVSSVKEVLAALAEFDRDGSPGAGPTETGTEILKRVQSVHGKYGMCM